MEDKDNYNFALSVFFGLVSVSPGIWCVLYCIICPMCLKLVQLKPFFLKGLYRNIVIYVLGVITSSPFPDVSVH